jgi:phenylacetate-CoA ligase
MRKKRDKAMGIQDERLRKIIHHAYQNAPAFRGIMEGVGLKPDDIQSIVDLAKIPVTSKDVLIEQQQTHLPFGGWLAVPPNTLRRIFISPGPIFDAQGNETVNVEAAAEAFQAVGIGPGDVVLNTFLYHLVPAGILLDDGLAAAGATVVPTGPGNTDYQAQIALGLRASGYIGTPSFLKIILDKIAEMNVPKAAVPIKKAFFTAEPYPQSLRDLFEGEYGMSTSQAYATADLGFIAYEQPGRPGMKVSKQLIVEIVNPETGQPVPSGEVGEVVCTTFNETYPLIRLGTGDLSAFTDEHKTHIRGWMGRVGDAIKVRGMFLHPAQLKGALAAINSLENVQAVVTRPDSRDMLTLKVELADEAADKDTLVEQIKSAVQTACRLRIDQVDFVAPASIAADARMIVDARTWD